jgi:hypothetical protein
LHEAERWFADKEFTSDWLSDRLPYWAPALAEFRKAEARVLDIGSFEGRSAIAFLEMLPRSHVTTVDSFGQPEIEARCRKNLSPYGHRVEIIKMGAAAAMEKLSGSFDVIYLDAAKTQEGAFAHSILAWPLLQLGGVIIWDDLYWQAVENPNEWDNALPGQGPGPGIFLFYETFKGCLSLLSLKSQLIARKTREWPETRHWPRRRR